VKPKNTIEARHELLTCEQLTGESIDNFVVRLKPEVGKLRLTGILCSPQGSHTYIVHIWSLTRFIGNSIFTQPEVTIVTFILWQLM